MTEERDSQLSAMFDGELPAGECELLARRLTRDDALRALWSRFSMIGAALRAERGVALHDRVAWRVQNAIAQEAVYGEGGSRGCCCNRTQPGRGVGGQAFASPQRALDAFCAPRRGRKYRSGCRGCFDPLAS